MIHCLIAMTKQPRICTPLLIWYQYSQSIDKQKIVTLNETYRLYSRFKVARSGCARSALMNHHSNTDSNRLLYWQDNSSVLHITRYAHDYICVCFPLKSLISFFGQDYLSGMCEWGRHDTSISRHKILWLSSFTDAYVEQDSYVGHEKHNCFNHTAWKFKFLTKVFSVRI